MYQPHRLMQETIHRPWPIPRGQWRYYQEWNNALFLHWKVPGDMVKELIPQGLTLDTLEGEAWVSLVAFTMQKIRPRYVPSFKPISDFHELNLRTYVRHGDKAGVYFISLEAEKFLSAFLARKMSGLPYMHSEIYRAKGHYHSANHERGFSCDAWFNTGTTVRDKSTVDKWLTERYCLYLDEAEALYRFDIHHLPWPLQQVCLNRLEVDYAAGHLRLSERTPDLAHYSPGVKVLAWSRQKL